MPLTDMACRTAKPGPKRRKLSDGEGLQLWVQPNGSRLWQLAYRFNGRQKQMSLGPYPDVSLAEARDRRFAARRLLRDGIDPADRRKRLQKGLSRLLATLSKTLQRNSWPSAGESSLLSAPWRRRNGSLAWPIQN
jgi:hypothetical protein